jgi:hypothetical protein
MRWDRVMEGPAAVPTTRLAAKQVRRHHRIMVIRATEAPQNRSVNGRFEWALTHIR